MRSSNSARSIRVRRGLASVLIACLLALLPVFAEPVLGVPTGITFSRITPVDGTTLLVARTAADNPLGSPTFQLKADVYLNNSSVTDQVVALVTFSYPGSSIPDRTYTPSASMRTAWPHCSRFPPATRDESPSTMASLETSRRRCLHWFASS